MRTLILMIAAMIAASSQASLPPLTVQRDHLVAPNGKTFTPRGVNVGNWLVLEMWMLQWSGYRDQFDVETILGERFGQDETDRLMDVYRSSWMTDRDWAIIPTFGFNAVRLPFNYRLLEDDAHPMVLRPHAFLWLDRAVDAAERHGLYSILDLHGAQGGQSAMDHTGHSGQNKLWSSEEDQQRMAWLWGELAKHYRKRSAVMAYDVFNEPYGGTKEGQVKVFRRCYDAIREQDPDKLVYAHGNYDTFTHYGDPHSIGWHNVGFEMHYYPGLFGNGEPTPATHARHLANLKTVAMTVKRLDVPFLVGEFNVVFEKDLGPAMMRRTFDVYNGYGWGATMWCYKLMSDGGGFKGGAWGIVTSKDKALSIDLRTASKSEIEKAFRSYATMPLITYDALRSALTSSVAPAIALPAAPEPILVPPAPAGVPHWNQSDVGNPALGGLVRPGDADFDLYGGGADIWGHHDDFRFLHRSCAGDFELTVTLEALYDSDGYAKAGIMARANVAADSAFLLLSSFPGGTIQLAERATAGADARGVGDGGQLGLPITLRLIRKGGAITASVKTASGAWREIGTRPFQEGPIEVGLVSSSHADPALTKATYRDLNFVER